jgi:uncharacterized membrane protein
MNEPKSAPGKGTAGQPVNSAEILAASLLRLEVFASLAIIIFGMLLSFIHHPSYLFSSADLPRLSSPGAAFPHTLRQIAEGLSHWRGQAFVAAGLALLILNPILKVAAAIFGFLSRRDRIFVFIAIGVLGLLLLSFALGTA